jgi:TRAP-type C4-dicarboxylate transport system substrate-binding protein
MKATMVAMKRMGALLMAVSAVVLLVACASSGSDKAGGSSSRKPLVLTLANFLGDSTELAGFAGEVSRLSGGSLRIDVRSGWRLGQVAYEKELIEDVRAGKADLGAVGSRAWDLVGVTSLRALTAPLLIDSYALEARVVSSPMIAGMLRGISPLGLVGLGVLPGPLRKPLGVARPLLGPSDYAPLRFGVQLSQVANATMRVLGAQPVSWPDEAGTAPINGFGGIEQQISAIQNNQFDGVGRYLTANVNLWPRPLVVFANAAVFAKLTPVQRRILIQAAANAARSETNVVVDNERYDTETLCHRRRLLFLTAGPADVAALRRAVRPVYDQLDRDPQTRQFIARIEALRKEAVAEPSPSCGPTPHPATKPGPLDGVYRYTVTAAQLRAAGVQAADIIPENYGTFTVVFERGRFAQTQEDTRACTWRYGTIAVNARRLEELVEAGGGIAPNRALSKPGEFSLWRWSLYRDELRLTQISPPGSPTQTWTRISTSPSARYFPKRCPPPATALPG